jgi:adenylate cyclase
MLQMRILRSLLWRVVFGALAGALYSEIRYRSPVTGAAVGAVMAASFVGLERIVLRRNAGGLVRPLPFLAYFGLRSALYLCVIVATIAAVGELAAGDSSQIAGSDVVFSLALVIAANLFVSVNDLLGPGVLFAFAAGRYYRPRIEERALLFIDMRASTAIAERLGELRFLDLLNRFVADVSLAIAEAGGDIHKYVGDEVIATWRLSPGMNEPACVRACFAALARIRAEAQAYERVFGLVPDFRAGLHCGQVAVGELGTMKKEIALIGDTMNATARIQDACRSTDNRVLASAALLERIEALPSGVLRRPLGELALRGKERPIELHVLEAKTEARGRDPA